MNNAAFYVSILSWILAAGLLVLVAAGKIGTKTYYLIVHYTLTVFLALSTLFCFAFTAIFLVDIFILRKFGYPIWSILLMLPFHSYLRRDDKMVADLAQEDASVITPQR